MAILIFGIFLIPSAIFNLSFARFLLSYVPYLGLISGISLVSALIIRKNKRAGSLIILITLSFISFILVIINILENQDEEKVEWNSSNNSFTIDFVVGRNGHIYFEASVNDTSGLFLFDTGAAISVVNEKFVVERNVRLHPYTLTDSKGIQQTKNLYKVNNFLLGDIEIKRLQVYPKDSITWTEPKGIFYKQDSIIGVIGNNIISKFIWDFDLMNKKVTISKSKKYCRAIPDSLSVPLLSNNENKDIPVKINGVEKMLTLDFGSSGSLSISDSIPNKLISNKSAFSQNTIGAFNHLDSTKRERRNIDFVDVEFGSFSFNEVMCSENDQSDLLGLPFIWAFERVIIDYKNDKVYFINENRNLGGRGEIIFGRYNIWNNASEIKRDSTTIIISKDNYEKRYVFYGRLTLYQSRSGIDSIYYRDSLFTDGKIRHGPSTFTFD